MSWRADFLNRYKSPKVERVTVGFTGIDPDEHNGSISEEELNKLLQDYISNLTISIDSGNIDTGTGEQDEPSSTPQIFLQKPHEELDGLLGGDESGHYHLTEEELGKLRNYPQYQAINRVIRHEELPDLLGGTSGGHYHLTEEQLAKLDRLTEALVPSITTPITITSTGTDDHEVQSNLLGGNRNGHYHLTDEEWSKVGILLDTTFPDGSVTPVFPGGGSDTSGGEGDDTGGEAEDDADLPSEAGLPPSTPPDWQTVQLPAKCTFYEGAGNMPYLEIIKGKSLDNALFVPMIYNKSTSNIRVNCSKNLSPSGWITNESSVSIRNYGKTLTQCLYVDWNTYPSVKTVKDNFKRIYFIFYPSTRKNVEYRTYSGTSVSYQSLPEAQSLVAAAFSAPLGRTIFITAQGNVSIVFIKKLNNKNAIQSLDKSGPYKCGISDVNYGSAVWINAYNCFCATGKSGIATSSTGETWTYKVGDGVNIPKDLSGLTFRSDIEYVDNTGKKYQGCAFGWSGADKTFWKSYDGQHWMRHNTKPIPLATVKSVAYSPTTGMYCAVGTPKVKEDGLYAYFSKTLEGWVKSKVSIDNLSVESVTWMANTGLFVLMPSSGSFLYTFAATDWK